MGHQSKIPGDSFGFSPVAARPLDAGMGMGVALRTVFRKEDRQDWGRVADRVSQGNIELLPSQPGEFSYLRNAIASGTILMSGRHLQHGAPGQIDQNLELFTNCATACTSYALFYLLLNGSGVGRSYDDVLMAIDWTKAPRLKLRLASDHPDHPRSAEQFYRFARDFGLLPWGTTVADMDDDAKIHSLRKAYKEIVIQGPVQANTKTVVFLVPDSREGWARAVEMLEAMTFAGQSDYTLVLDFSGVRESGAPIAGMQDRPASGPLSVIKALHEIRSKVITSTSKMSRWLQTFLVDHYLAACVVCGGVRRAARMSTKDYRDPDIADFVRVKGGLEGIDFAWTTNCSVTVDQAFHDRAKAGDRELFDLITARAYVNGEPGIINVHKLDDHIARRPRAAGHIVVESRKYQTFEAVELMAEMARRVAEMDYPIITNPCGEIVLSVSGGYCCLADVAPVLACPVELDEISPGNLDDTIAVLWRRRVIDAVRLAVRALIRTNRMDALYGAEVARTNRIGVGLTGLHEAAWLMFGFTFHDLIDEDRSIEFWSFVSDASSAAKAEAVSFAAEMGVEVPWTVVTIKPSGSVSKLFGLTEGAHLPSKRYYLRNVQFRATKNSDDAWSESSDPILIDYERKGYPVRALQTFEGMSIVGFPTQPLLSRLMPADKIVTASEAMSRIALSDGELIAAFDGLPSSASRSL